MARIKGVLDGIGIVIDAAYVFVRCIVTALSFSGESIP